LRTRLESNGHSELDKRAIDPLSLAVQKGEGMGLTNDLAGRNLGMLLLGLWLILTGLLPLLNMKLSSTVTTGLAVLGIVAGILILLRR
jgi:hypothetical protein